MTQLCIGGGSHPNADAGDILAAFGVQGPYWLTDAQYLTFCKSPSGENWAPTSPTDIGPYGYGGMVLACVKSRSLLFCNATPGDVAQTNALQQVEAITSQQDLTAGVVADATVAGIGVSLQKSAQQSGGSSALGGTLGIIADIGSVILGVFAHHAGAVKTQATALGQLCPQVTNAIAKIDASVKIGQLTPTNAQTALVNLSQQFKQAIAPYTKQCNAFCYYAAILDSIVASSQAVYSCQGFIAASPASIVSTITSVLTGGESTTTPTGASAGTTGASSSSLLLLGLAALVGLGIYEVAR